MSYPARARLPVQAGAVRLRRFIGSAAEERRCDPEKSADDAARGWRRSSARFGVHAQEEWRWGVSK